MDGSDAAGCGLFDFGPVVHAGDGGSGGADEAEDEGGVGGGVELVAAGEGGGGVEGDGGGPGADGDVGEDGVQGLVEPVAVECAAEGVSAERLYGVVDACTAL